jgi:hypothetical protein
MSVPMKKIVKKRLRNNMLAVQLKELHQDLTTKLFTIRINIKPEGATIPDVIPLQLQLENLKRMHAH